MLNFNSVDPIIEAVSLQKEVTIENTTLTILKNVSLKIRRGESVAIVGTSGAGKTTLLSLLAGLDMPSSGSVILGGVDIYSLDEEDRTIVRGSHIGFIFQTFYLLENLTALENVALPLEIHNHDKVTDRAMQILSEVGLADRASHYPRQLSGGEQQRVAIARAFANEPAILFADEPTGNLDQTTGEKIFSLLFELNKSNNTTLVMITHDAQFANLCDRIITMDKGAINS